MKKNPVTLADNIPAAKGLAAHSLGRPSDKAWTEALTPAKMTKSSTKGAKAPAEILTQDQRYEIARKAAEARASRWSTN
jgi:hypothetical protein